MITEEFLKRPSDAMLEVQAKQRRDEREFCRRALWFMISVWVAAVLMVIVGILTTK